LKCPKCDKEMELGLVSVPFNRKIVWSEKPIKMLFSGEVIPLEGGFLRRIHMDGFRCTACRLIVTRYLDDGLPKPPREMISPNQDDPQK